MLRTPMGPGFFIFFQDTDLTIKGGSGSPDYEEAICELIYQEISQKTVKKLAKKVKKYQKAAKVKVVSKESINAIVETMVDTWPQAEMQEKMQNYNLNEYNAILAYKNTLRSLFDDDLALILILASL